MVNDCPSVELLQSIAAGTGPSDGALTDHIRDCPTCREWLSRNQVSNQPATTSQSDQSNTGRITEPAVRELETLDRVERIPTHAPVDAANSESTPTEIASPPAAGTEPESRPDASASSASNQVTLDQIEDLVLQLPANERPTDLEALRPHLVEIPIQSPTAAAPASSDNNGELPRGAKIGRFTIVKKLGGGGFGNVYLATDDGPLSLRVAIKIPHLNRFRGEVDRLLYLTEAQTVAKLDHPGIADVFEFGAMTDGRSFVVSKFVDGQNLAQVLGQQPMELREAVRILVAVAETLKYIHEQHLVHRDIKPANLLIGKDGRVFVADFGLVLPESRQLPTTLAGTPGYMSPEQVRREGHRIDGRSDQFGFGCVMYEVLTGVMPFAGKSNDEILHKSISHHPPSLTDYNQQLPRDLNRICMKLLSKLASQRYATTAELVDELQLCLAKIPKSATTQTKATSLAAHPPRDSQRTVDSIAVVPRGLRSFTPDDADFFHRLVPGPRDRSNRPPILSHWIAWVSAPEDEPEFHRVGVISGPPGAGKSSIVRAGILPNLDPSVVTIFVEATPDATEKQLNDAINRRCNYKTTEPLAEKIAAIRRGQALPAGKSLLIVIDQFEQWLHAHPNPADEELVSSIRQCDGIHVQCIVLVRDDFWLALNRFTDAVESPLILHRNATMVDLFDPAHARKVLIEFGRSFGQLPVTVLSKEQDRFIDQSVSHLSTDGKIFPVQLALFAEMVKTRSWIPATLTNLGGAIGIGAQFLNEAFSAPFAPARQRAHEAAARAILQSLLPPMGTEIKASRRPRSDLKAASGYAGQPERFAAVMEILENDLKLISPSDLQTDAGAESIGDSSDTAAYQLSHDFLVPSIREWLSAKQRETFRGRLHQRVSEQAAIWNQQREARFLPSFREWCLAKSFLSNAKLTQPERDMLQARNGRSVALVCTVLALLFATSFGLREFRGQVRAHGLVEQVQTAGVTSVPGLIEQLSAYRWWAERALNDSLDKSDPGSHERFMLSLAGLPWKISSPESVLDQVIDRPESGDSAIYLSAAVDALTPFANDLSEKCWAILEAPPGASAPRRFQRLRAAQFLAAFDPPIESKVQSRWTPQIPFLSEQLIRDCAEHPDHFELNSRLFRPAASCFIPELAVAVGAADDNIQNHFSMLLLSDYIAGDPIQKTRAYLDASLWQRRLLITSTEELSDEELWSAVKEQLPDTKQVSATKRLHRKGLAGAVLLSSSTNADSPDLWSILKRAEDETARSVLVHNMNAMRVPADTLISKLREEADPGIISALLLALGSYESPTLRTSPAVLRDISTQFSTNPDSGVHSAAEWLLRVWGNSHLVEDLIGSVDSEVEPGPVFKGWTRVKNGLTFAVIRASREPSVGRDIFFSTKEVTIASHLKCNNNKYINAEFGPTPDCPSNVVLWRQAAEYCNWLSKNENLPLFYPVDNLDPNNWSPTTEDLNKPGGYRLAMKSEWDFACQAGTTTPRYFGGDLELFQEYAWLKHNAKIGNINGMRSPISSPVGLLKPNNYGLFDMLGNVREWCGDLVDMTKRPAVGSSVKDVDAIACEKLGGFAPTEDFDRIGFRVVRTIHGALPSENHQVAK